MVLEATVIVLDNSEWMRNGDYTPTRLEAQNDAVNLIFNSKRQSHPENTVGLLTMAGKSPQVLVTLTEDAGKILTALHGVCIAGNPMLASGMQVAQLALKHRQNKNQKQRIVTFVGSPIAEAEKDLVRLGKKLKKNGIAVDIVSFGEAGANVAKLEAFLAAVNNNDNSHLVTVPPGPHILSDILISSAVVQGEDGAGGAGMGGGGGAFEFGVDPTLDPELAMALRLSMEEENARQGGSTATTAADSEAAAVASMTAVPGGDDELARALAMSMAGDGDVEMTEELTEEQELAQAIALSMNAEGGAEDAMQDPAFMNSVLGNLAGVDPSDPRIREAMEEDGKEEEGSKTKKSKTDK